MLDNLKLRGRIFLGFSIPVVLILGFSLLVYFRVNQILEIFQEVKRAQETIIETDEMVLRKFQMERDIRGYFLTKEEDKFDNFNNNYKLYLVAVARVQPLILDTEQKSLFTKLVDSGQEYYQITPQTFQLQQQGKQDEALSFYLNNSQKVVDQINQAGEEFNDVELVILENYTNQAHQAIQFLVLTAITITITSLILATGAASLIWTTVAKTNNTIRQTVTVIATSSSEIATTVEEQERILNQQALSMDQTTITINELGAASKISAQQAEATATCANQVLGLAKSSTEGANQVLRLAQNGTNIVEQTLNGISTLKNKVEEIAEQILRLQEQMKQIGTIINLVSDLANQTNMLALNAAVEAVRAGEYGKGFAVVAAEIRKLADQSRASAERVNNLILGIQGSILSTVRVTEEGTKTAETGIQLSEQTSMAFQDVTNAINEIILSNQDNSLMSANAIVTSSQQIVMTSQQQAAAIQQLVTNMQQLNQSASETASGITQTKIGIQRLHEVAQSLNDRV